LNGKSSYVNPVDGKVYSTDSGFKKYEPDAGIKPANGPVKTLNIVLLTDQNKLENIIGVKKLASFIKSTDSIVYSQFSEAKEKGEILVQFTLYSDKKPKVEVSFSGSIDTLYLRRAVTEINNRSSQARTLKDSCVYQSHYGVNFK